MRSGPNNSVGTVQMHSFSDVLGHCLSLSAWWALTTKRRAHSVFLIMGKVLCSTKPVAGDSKQTVEIMKIRMKVVKELAVKIEGVSECKSYHRERHTACTTLFSVIFFAFYSVQAKPLEEGSAQSLPTEK